MKSKNLKIFTLFIVSSVKQEFIILPFQFCYVLKGLVQDHILALSKKVNHLNVSLEVKNSPEESYNFGSSNMYDTYLFTI